MTISHTTLDIPKNPAERRAWIKFQFEVRGVSIRAFARLEGVSQQAVSAALLGFGSSHLQEAIARFLSVPPHRLYPEHYDDRGGRRGRTREQHRNRTTPVLGCNVEKEVAA